MPNRTEILHFRATPEEKERIKENAGHAEVALSTWMRERSLSPAIQWGVTPTQPAVDGVSLQGGDRISNATLRPEGGIYKVTSVGETYEQFMDRRVGELVGGEVTADEYAEACDKANAEWAEWVERRRMS